MPRPLVAIITLNWKQLELTIQTIDSLLAIDTKFQNYRIFLIDNGSPDDSFVRLQQRYANQKLVTCIRSESNLGFAAGNNFGIEQAKAINPDYYLFINNDVTVKKNFLDKLVKFTQDYPEVSLTNPKIYFAKGFEYQKKYQTSDLGKVIWSIGGQIDWANVYGSNLGIDEVDQGQYQQPIFNLDYVSGCCLLVKSEVIKKIGAFDAKFFMYLEDDDLSQRAKIAGFKNGYCPEAVIWHYNSGSSGAGSPLHDYFLTRNRLLFGYRYASLKTKLALFRDSVRIYLTSPSVWQKRGVLDYYLGRLHKGSWR